MVCLSVSLCFNFQENFVKLLWNVLCNKLFSDPDFCGEFYKLKIGSDSEIKIWQFLSLLKKEMVHYAVLLLDRRYIMKYEANRQ